MKISLLFILSAFCILSVQAQIVNIPDANFKNALLNHVPVINSNNDGEIQVSEAVAFNGTMNVTFKFISDLTGIQSFTNLQILNCAYNNLFALDITGLNALTEVNCAYNMLTGLSISNHTSLRTLYCGFSRLTTLQLTNLPALEDLESTGNSFTSLSLSGLQALKNLTLQSCYSLTNLTLSNLPALKSLNCNNCVLLSGLNMSGIALETLSCNSNKLTSLTLSNPAVLISLDASNNLLTALPAGLSAIKNLSVSHNKISSFLIDNLNSLVDLRIDDNLCTSLSLTNKPVLLNVYCYDNQINNLQVNNCNALKTLYCYKNQIASLTLSNLPALEAVRCYNNLLTSLTISNTPKMKDYMCYNNKLTTLSISNMPLLQWVRCENNLLTNLSLGGLPLLYEINCSNNQLNSLPYFNYTILPKLQTINFSSNQVPRLIVDIHPILQQIIADDNPIDSVRLKYCNNLSWLSLQKTKLSNLKLDSLPALRTLYCGKSDSLKSVDLRLAVLYQFNCDSSKLVTLDLSQTSAIECLTPHNSLLQYINLRNGAVRYSPYATNFSDNPSLRFICVDDPEKPHIIDSVLSQLPGQGVTISTVCNFTPGVTNTVKGTIRFDADTNGCNSNDSTMANVKLTNNDGTYLTSAFSNNIGEYNFKTLANIDTVNVVLQQPSWFNVVPPMQVINFPGPGSIAIANFCITPNGVHPDLEITLLPLTIARPGFTSQYKLVYSNKGNQVLSGNASLSFDPFKMNFLSALPNVTSQTAGNLIWNYSGLSPFETRSITISFRINPPPVVNNGDILAFSEAVNPITGDETPNDNTSNFNQVVRGAFDPNDKDVTEGPAIDISKAGNYLHYIIRFQNTGNAVATNVTIKDSLANNLDWNSLVPLAASHSYRTVISKGNKTEFIFDNINLPDKNTNEPGSHGFVSFKIKPKSTLAVGETISNKAEIYFDYNLPIITNTVSTTITETKHNSDPAGLTVAPNPAKDWLQFSLNPGTQIKSVILINTFGVQVYNQEFKTTTTYQRLNVGNLAAGMYFLIVYSYQWRSMQKVMILK
jgi:uncharacterized repeat protein (TIGR01451 family)